MQAGSIDTLRRTGVVPPGPGPSVGSRRGGWAIGFGIVVPLACLALDPCVFRTGGMSGLFGLPVMGAHAVAAYVLVLIALVALTAWLRKPRWAAWLAGPLLVSGLAAAGIALVILPVALLGIVFFGVGLLGFLPFGTAWVYLRAGWRALRLMPRRRRLKTWALTLVLGGLTVGLPLLAQRAIDGRTQELVQAAQHGDDAALERAVGRLKPFGWLANAEIPFDSWRWSDTDAPLSRRLYAAWVAAGGAPLEALVD